MTIYDLAMNAYKVHKITLQIHYYKDGEDCYACIEKEDNDFERCTDNMYAYHNFTVSYFSAPAEGELIITGYNNEGKPDEKEDK